MGLLSETKAWRRVAKELSAEGGTHYVPVEEALVHKVRVFVCTCTLLCVSTRTRT